jgi:membrane associated rhomboid family serine protease
MALPSITPVVKRLMMINGAGFLIFFFIWLASSPVAEGMVRWLGLAPGLWEESFPLLPVWQVITYAFLHSAMDPMHLLFNMLLLYFFGTMLEAILGSNRFLTLYLGAAFSGALLHLLLGGGAPVIGASGAVLGVLVATAVLRPDATVFLFFFPVRLKWLAAGIVVLDAMRLLIGLKSGQSDMVAHYVHLGGALYGFLAARQGWVRWDPIGRWRQRKAEGRVERRQVDQERLDGLLEKIHSQGLGSLTQREKEFLKRVSRKG